jgi:hypothetical protein
VVECLRVFYHVGCGYSASAKSDRRDALRVGIVSSGRPIEAAPGPAEIDGSFVLGLDL